MYTRKLDDCLNVASTAKFKMMLKRAAFLERTTMSRLAREWLIEAYEKWALYAPSRIEFDIFLTSTEVTMLRTRGYRVEEISVDGCTDSDSSVPTPDRSS